jgi:hypothetical protein
MGVYPEKSLGERAQVYSFMQNLGNLIRIFVGHFCNVLQTYGRVRKMSFKKGNLSPVPSHAP